MTRKKAVLYARVSTDDQSDKGYSIPSQFDAMRKYATQQDFENVAEFQDDYSGATPIEHRPEGRKAYAMLQSGEADVIIAYTIDRFVRPPEDGDEWEMPILIRGLAKLGKEIHTCDIGKLKTDFVSLLLVVLGAKSAGEERRKIRERTVRGRMSKARAGNVVGGRSAPYGYQFEYNANAKTCGLLIYEPEARIVRLIYRWYVHGDEHGKKLSCISIARKLTELSVPTPGLARKSYKRKRGNNVWSTSQVHEMIKREVYAGQWWYGARIGATRTYRPRTEQVSVRVPAIVDLETWERAQAQRQRNRELSPRNVKHNYLLRGMIMCGECGRAMCGTMTRGYLYYACSYKNNHHTGLEHNCTAKSIRADKAETEAWGDIEKAMRNAAEFEELLREAQRKEDTTYEPMRAELEAIDGLLQDADREADEIGATMRIARGRVGERIQKQMDDCNARIAELTTRRQKIVAKLGERQFTDDAITELLQLGEDIRAGLDNPTFDDKRRYLELLKAKVTVTQGVVCVTIVPNLF